MKNEYFTHRTSLFYEPGHIEWIKNQRKKRIKMIFFILFISFLLFCIAGVTEQIDNTQRIIVLEKLNEKRINLEKEITQLNWEINSKNKQLNTKRKKNNVSSK